ncbi:hypothetical protein RAG67_27410, partial [Klebsiella pneumoniae]
PSSRARVCRGWDIDGTNMFSDYIAEKTGFRVQFDIEQLKPDLNVDATDRFQQQNLEDVLVD